FSVKIEQERCWMHLRRVIVTVMAAASLGLLQCSNVGNGSSHVGFPCTPSLETDPAFSGFKITEATIEVGAPECGGGVCLINHFQGRVSCPLGQPSPGGGQGPGGCQLPDADPKDNAGKGCCLPGTGTPSTTAVCGQCKGSGNGEFRPRDAESTVYCS